MKIQEQPHVLDVRPPEVRRPAVAAVGRSRKIALLGGAKTILYAPFHDPSWELWAHMSCRKQCKREPDRYFDLHPPELWRNPKKKWWDKTYLRWLAANRTPIYMQERYPDAPASIRYPFETMITEFPRGYMTNTVAYMVALALMEGVTHLALYGCHYDAMSEYGPQRGCCEYWLGVAEGRGVTVLIPPHCDLLARPSLLYGYQSHPNGVRDKSYAFAVGTFPQGQVKANGSIPEKPYGSREMLQTLVPSDAPNAPPHCDIGHPPALERRDAHTPEAILAQHRKDLLSGVHL